MVVSCGLLIRSTRRCWQPTGARAADRNTAADKTGADGGLWVERAIREAVAGRSHAVIKATMRQPEVVRRTGE